MELKFIEAVMVQSGIGNDILWLKNVLEKAPVGVAEDILAIIDKKQLVLDDLSAQMETFVVKAPADRRYMSKGLSPQNPSRRP